jgi:hypothetical protein
VVVVVAAAVTMAVVVMMMVEKVDYDKGCSFIAVVGSDVERLQTARA